MTRPVGAALLPAAAVGTLLAGLALHWTTGAEAETFWTTGLVLTGAPLLWRTVRALHNRHFATDVIATLAIVGAVLLRQPVAGLVVVIMQSGGELLELYAAGRASRAVRALEEAAPHTAHRLVGTELEDVPVDRIVPGDLLLVRPGEMIPCDGAVADGSSHVDTASLTGESVPRRARRGDAVASGSLNQESVLVLRATAVARESQYARIVELVRSAESQKAPMQRLADRYAAWFTPATLVVCAATWLLSGDPVRVLAVLVVATPCPLILAAPVAVIGGINLAARRGIIFRTGAALEELGAVTAAIFDKTGTLTVGRPAVRTVHASGAVPEPELLRLAASVEQASGHLLARTVVEAARGRGLRLEEPSGAVEAAGRGVSGGVGARVVTVGARSFVSERHPAIAGELAALESRPALRAYVAVDGRFAGTIEYGDQLRPDVSRMLDALRAGGVRRMLLLSGDTPANVSAVAREVGIAESGGDLVPADKVAAVHRLLAEGERVVMIGDGTNDAPAFGAATVGVVLAEHGGGIAAEAADVVLLADDLSLVATGMAISRRTMRIARTSIRLGLGLSIAAMALAAAGRIPPTLGALLQEAIDVASIVNALRASIPSRGLAAGTRARVRIPEPPETVVPPIMPTRVETIAS